MTTTMQSTMTPAMTPAMHEILSNSIFKQPTTHEERFKYANATLTNVIVNNSDYFKYFFFNNPEHFIEFAKWFDRKVTEPFTEKEMTSLKALNTANNELAKYFSLAIFKEIAIGVFDKDEFYEDLGVHHNQENLIN
jgi:hypothetical protein